MPEFCDSTRILNWLACFHIFHSCTIVMYRSSRPEVSCKGVLRNFKKFTGKHLCQSFFLKKVAGLGLGLQLFKKRDSGTCVFLWILWTLWGNVFSTSTSGGCFLYRKDLRHERVNGRIRRKKRLSRNKSLKKYNNGKENINFFLMSKWPIFAI